MKQVLLFISTCALSLHAAASAFVDPWTKPTTPHFFKFSYYSDFEAPLIDVYNDTGTNICLLLNKKATSANFISRLKYLEKDYSENKKQEQKDNPPTLPEVESYLEKNLPSEGGKGWKSSLKSVLKESQNSDIWWNTQPSVCGDHKKGISDFFVFIQAMELSEKEKATYLAARMELSEICESTTYVDPNAPPGSSETRASVDKYTHRLNDMIQKSKLRERISDYLIALAESYSGMESTLPAARAKALTKTNIEFLRDSFSYYVTRVLTTTKEDNEYSASDTTAPILKVTLPDLENRFLEKSREELWQQYIRDFPKGRFINSARGLLRRHGDYVVNFEKYLQELPPPVSQEQCDRIATEIHNKVAMSLYSSDSQTEKLQKDLLESPFLLTILTFQKSRRSYGAATYDVSEIAMLSPKFSHAELPEIKNPLHFAGEPSKERQYLASRMGFSKEFIKHLDSSKNIAKRPELRDMMKALVFYQSADYDLLHKIDVKAHKDNPVIYLSILRYKAWAFEAQGKFAEALSLWKEIKEGTELFASEYVSADVPILENYVLAQKWDFAWNDYAKQPLVLAMFLSRFASEENIFKGLEQKNLDKVLQKKIVTEFFNRSLVSERWSTLLKIKSLFPETKEFLPEKIWKHVENLAQHKDDAKSLVAIASHLLTNGEFIRNYENRFGTFPPKSFVFEPQDASAMFLKVLNLTEKGGKSEAEAEALSHLCTCMGRKYERDYVCKLDGQKFNLKDRQAWFRTLHNKYKGSTWAKKTPTLY